MGKTSIEWSEFSVNPFRARNKETGRVGHCCAKVSPGCKNCYSSRLQPRFGTFTFLAENRDKVELFLDQKVLDSVLRRKKPTTYFWCDMTDMFWEEHPDEWIDRCFAVMALTPQHTHQVLTKRAERMCQYFKDLAYRQEVIGIRAEYVSGLDRYTDRGGCPPRTLEPTWKLPFANVWLGVSAEDQQRADERIPWLLKTPAAVRFASYEPALGPIDLTCVPWPEGWQHPDDISDGVDSLRFSRSHLDWVIVGGESGTGARPFDIQRARDVLKQCCEAGVACFVKQMGARIIDRNDAGFEGDTPTSWPMDARYIDLDSGYQGAPVQINLRDRKGGNPDEWPPSLRVREYPKKYHADQLGSRDEVGRSRASQRWLWEPEIMTMLVFCWHRHDGSCAEKWAFCGRLLRYVPTGYNPRVFLSAAVQHVRLKIALNFTAGRSLLARRNFSAASIGDLIRMPANKAL